MKTDPDFFDAKIAGWWVWGISQSIGSGWCSHPEWRGRFNANHGHGGGGIDAPSVHKRPLLSGHSGGVGMHRKAAHEWTGRTNAGRAARGIHGEQTVHRKRVATMTAGKGVNRKIPYMGDWRKFNYTEPDGLYAWFSALAQRLRRVRVCCGDWKRVMGPAVTTCIGTTAVFLDPPYSVADRSDVYSHESRDVAHAVRDWARANGDNPDLRIALCGYEDEHDMPDTWECVAWKAAGGYGNQGDGRRPGKRGPGADLVQSILPDGTAVRWAGG